MTFELRTYTASPGRLDDLLARFRDHTIHLFPDHGIENVGYWLPETPDTLIYLIRHTGDPETNWDSFRADPRWTRAKTASIESGEIVADIASVFLEPTDFSGLQ